MPVNFFDVELAYANDKNLKKEDVKALIEWVQGQPHLPQINEPQAILFLQRSQYQIKLAQSGVDSYFTFKTLCPTYLDRNPLKSPLKEALDVACVVVLPKETPEGYSIVLTKLVDLDQAHFDFDVQLKRFDMIIMTSLYQQKISTNLVVLFDMTDLPEWLVAELHPDTMKKFWYYMQNVIPTRLRRLHYFNTVSFVDDVESATKPFMTEEMLDEFYFHKTVDDLVKHIPRECLPEDYGGGVESVSALREKTKNELLANVDFFEWEDKQIVDEKKRPEKSTLLTDMVAVIGSSENGLAPVFVDVETQYVTDRNLKKENVKALVEWAHNQPHLPDINEIQAIVFLQRWQYQKELAKNALDSYFTYKTFNSHLFLGRNPFNSPIKEAVDVCLYTVLPKKTPEGFRIVFGKLFDFDVDHFNATHQLRQADMIIMQNLYEKGSPNGYICIFDIKIPASFAYKWSPFDVKTFVHYLVEVVPLRFKKIHYFNADSFILHFMLLLKSSLSEEYFNLIHVHENVDDLTKFVPRECLPQDYGGSVEPTEVLQEIKKNKLLENAALFDWEDAQTVDETKRPDKFKTLKDILAIVSPSEKDVPSFFAKTDNEYIEDKNLKKEDVKEITDWVRNQQHLPEINEIQAIRFLQRWNYHVELTKNAVDSYFTFKTFSADLFLGRNPLNPPLDTGLDAMTVSILPKKTPEGFKILFAKMINFDLFLGVGVQAKRIDMTSLLHLYGEGQSKDFVFVADMKHVPHDALAKIHPYDVKRFLHYIQEIAPYQWKIFHIFNTPTWVKEFLNLIKPNLKDDLLANFHVHETLDDLVKYVPKEYLPADYGGSAESLAVLHEKTKSKLLANVAFFDWEDKQVVVENLRSGKYKAMTDILAVVQPFLNGNVFNGQNGNFLNGQNGGFVEKGN